MFGRTVFPTSSVFPTRVSADGAPDYKAGGVTIDWTNTVTAPGSDVTLPDGSLVKSGSKYLRYGQVLTRITTGQSQTLTGTATGGTFTLSGVRTDSGSPVTTAALAATATAAQVLAALQAVFGPGEVTTATGGALGTNPVVVNFGTNVALLTVNGGSLTGGTVTIANTTNTGTTGYYGPYDPAASDGRQTLTRGSCYVLDETLLQYGGGITHTVANDQVGGVIEGGLIFIDRVLQAGAGTHTLAAGPTLAEFLAAFPNFRIVQD